MSRYFDYRKGVPPTPDDICFDNLLYHALVDYLEDEGRDLERIHEEEAGPMPLPVRRKANGKYRRGKLARAAVAFLLAGAVSFLTLFGTVEAFRVKVYNVFIALVDNLDTPIGRSQGVATLTGSPQDNIFPEYLPKGFKITYFEVEDGVTVIEYSDGRSRILFEKQPLAYANLHDPGRDSNDYNIEINGCPGSISTFNSESLLLWSSKNTLFKLRTNLSTEEIIKIAESVYIN